MNILLTGYTGNLGTELAWQLAGHRVFALVRDPASAPCLLHVTTVPGALDQLPAELAPEIDVIIHSAACTAFRAPMPELRQANVEGTSELLDFARKCPHLQRFIHLSTTCVAGDLDGTIAEARIQKAPNFVNDYEQSKWEAECVVLDSGLPIEIARVSIVAGSARDGSVRRIGALHHTLHWLYRGLVPMMPGTEDSRVDIISTEHAARVVAAMMQAPVQPGRIVHASMGAHAPRLPELLEYLRELFSQSHRGWARGSIVRPEIVDAATFALFEQAARQSGDALFQRVCDDARSFLPGLLHARTFATSLSETERCADWKVLTQRVFHWLIGEDWGRNRSLRNAA